ncbi:hypothetical protein ACQ4PT_023657 [Festuca glaucescens]
MAPSSSLYSSGRLLPSRTASTPKLVGRWLRPTCSLAMNGCAAGAGDRGVVSLQETRVLPAASAPQEAVGQLRAAVAALNAEPPASSCGIIRIEVPIRQRGDAIEWLHAQRQSSLPRCFFSARAPLSDTPAIAAAVTNNGNGCHKEQWEQPVSVAGVGSAVFFRGTDPFSLRDWRAIKRFLSRDCPLIRAYGAIRFDATSDASVEWEDYGAFYFVVPQISPSSVKVNRSTIQTAIINLNHVPTKASWDLAVTKALQMIKGRQKDLVKVVLARCSRYITDTCIDPLELLACLKVEGQNAYQFCIQPPDAPAFVGNSMICDEVVVNPSKALRKLPRVQHLSAQLAARLRNENDEFDILNALHPSPAVCGLPTEEARQFIRDYEIFDRGMYAGPVGWFGGAESEFAVGIRSALLGKGHSTLVYAGAGIVEGTNPSFEWDELDLKASQFAKLLQYQEQHICYQEARNMGTLI